MSTFDLEKLVINEDKEELKTLIVNHHEYTKSDVAKRFYLIGIENCQILRKSCQ